MKKMRTLTTVAAAAIVLVGIAPATPGNLGANFAMFFGDSPIDISDGSIHADIGFWNLKAWDSIVPGEIYSSTTNNSQTISLHEFTNSSFPGNDHKFEQTGAWFIGITSADPKDNRTTNPEAISFCSTDGFSSVCDPTKLTIDPDQNLVLIETHPDDTHTHGHNGHWKEEPSILFITKKLTFQDTRPACKQHPDKCEHVSAITIRTANSSNGLPGPAGVTFTCSDPTNFRIRVGD